MEVLHPQRETGVDVEPVIIVHGGAGSRSEDADGMEAGCRRAAERGRRLLVAGADAVDAVEQAVNELEDDPLFTAGTGAALNSDGELELDASIMEGTGLRAGAVAALPPFAHPVSVSRAVLEDGRHVLYAGEGARAFALAIGISEAPPGSMHSERSVRRLESVMQATAGPPQLDAATRAPWFETVGAVALDDRGRLAAATSTGGTVGQRPGRVGDTPVIGGGTYADDGLGACSTTGLGEAIMRACLAFRAVSLLGSVPVQIAADAAVRTMRDQFGGTGGLILLDRRGRVGVARTTPMMSHAIARGSDEVRSGV